MVIDSHLINYILQAEEMIKQEMIVMFHYDALKNPTAAQQGMKDGAKKPSQKGMMSQTQHMTYLEAHPHKDVPDEEIAAVSTVTPCSQL